MTEARPHLPSRQPVTAAPVEQQDDDREAVRLLEEHLGAITVEVQRRYR